MAGTIRNRRAVGVDAGDVEDFLAIDAHDERSVGRRRTVDEPDLKASNATDRFGIFHVVNEGETTWRKFAVAIMDGAAQRGLLVFLFKPPGEFGASDQ